MATAPTFPLNSLLEKEKLHASGDNFTDWFRNLRIVLKSAKKDSVIMQALPDAPGEGATARDRNAYNALVDESNSVSCLMLASMEPGVQKRFEN